jgi:hypothetical protein
VNVVEGNAVGLMNAPATLQSVMNDVFRSQLWDFVVLYLDDFLIYSKTKEEHRKHVRIVLDLLQKEFSFTLVLTSHLLLNRSASS